MLKYGNVYCCLIAEAAIQGCPSYDQFKKLLQDKNVDKIPDKVGANLFELNIYEHNRIVCIFFQMEQQNKKTSLQSNIFIFLILLQH